jgi:hypothetical protein
MAQFGRLSADDLQCAAKEFSDGKKISNPAIHSLITNIRIISSFNPESFGEKIRFRNLIFGKQEATRGRIRVVYTPTDDMMANGLTKVLPNDAHQRFVHQMGLVDITERLQECHSREVTQEDLDQIEDYIAGGEVVVC